jgi:hypothetical protein
MMKTILGFNTLARTVEILIVISEDNRLEKL